MDEKHRTATSKFLSFVLRHEPGAVGIELEVGGWVSVEVLLEAMARQGRRLTREELEEVVRTNGKQRFAFSDDGRCIRANQGHSVPVDLGYEHAEPPDVLFHGTVRSVIAAIRVEGLRRMERHHVHLSSDEASARIVGMRRGTVVVLQVDARAMRDAGHRFFVTPNGVWLTDAVPPQFISRWPEA